MSAHIRLSCHGTVSQRRRAGHTALVLLLFLFVPVVARQGSTNSRGRKRRRDIPSTMNRDKRKFDVEDYRSTSTNTTVFVRRCTGRRQRRGHVLQLHPPQGATRWMRWTGTLRHCSICTECRSPGARRQPRDPICGTGTLRTLRTWVEKCKKAQYKANYVEKSNGTLKP